MDRHQGNRDYKEEYVGKWERKDDLAASPKVEFEDGMDPDQDGKDFKDNFWEGEDPTASSGQYQLQRKGEKKTFQCLLCLIPLSSLETMMSHKQGAKHTRKVIAKQEEVREMFYRGEISREEEEEELNKEWIMPVSNPQSLKMKVPVRLHEKILDCEEPVVGLDYITELLPESDPEMEPQYTCRLCGSTGPANGMFTHLMGGTHRHAFLEKMGEYFHKRETKAMMKRVRVYAENKMRLADKIKTVHCDASYPWPAGKAPWSLEMGGDGIPPPAKHTQTSSRVRTATVTSTPEPATLLPAPGNLQRPKTAEEAQEMLDTAMLMMQKVADFAKKENKVSEQEASVLKQTFNLGSNSSF